MIPHHLKLSRTFKLSKLKENNLVAQSNSLIEARYAITKNEQLLLFAMVSMLSPKDEAFLTLSTTVNELTKVLALDRKSSVREIEKVIDRLMKRVLRISTPTGWRRFHWVSYAELKSGQIFLKFDDELKPYLLALKKTGNFTQFRLGMVIHFRSVYSIRLYQLLKEYESKRIYQFEFSIEDFRKIMLGENSKSYPLYKDFKKKVLNVAKKELEEKDKKTLTYKSDLSFDLETRRIGRYISHINFIIKPQTTTATHSTSNIIPHHDKQQTDPEIITAITTLGITTSKAISIAQQYDTNYILNKLNVINEKQQTQTIKNPAGFLIKALQNDWKSEAETQQAAEKEAKQKAEQKALKTAQEQQQKEAFIQERTQKVTHFLDALNYGKSMAIMRQFEASDLFKQTIKKDLLLNNLYQSTGIDDDEIKNHFNTFIISTHLDPSLNDFQAWQEKTALNKT